MTYEYTDEMISYIDKQLIARYSRLKSLASFDEINVLNEINEMYHEISAIVKKTFLLLANRVYSETRREKSLKSLDDEWVDNLLDGYNPVSKYVFAHEIDRKCARLIEAVIASDSKAQEIDTAMRAMSFMCRMYADIITDEAVMQAYNDDGESFIRWVAEKDEKTCSTCKRRDGQIYEIDLVPTDPHPNCRCRRERMQE